MITMPAELTRRIQDLIDELEPPDELGYWPTRVCKYDLNALPLHGNLIYIWALRPDGVLLRMDHESLGHPTEPETDLFVVYAVLTNATKKIPELQALVPVQPEGARPCATCNATGIVERGPEAYECCLGCNGLGWQDVRALH